MRSGDDAGQSGDVLGNTAWTSETGCQKRREMNTTPSSSYPFFDRSRLRLRPLSEREHIVALADVLTLDAEVPPFEHPDLPKLVDRIVTARKNGRPVILMMGAHVIKKGCSRFVIELMERKVITHVAANGACTIHDFELALIGGTSESVPRYITEGQFGLWQETARLNDAFKEGMKGGLGMGEAAGRAIEEWELPHRDVSVCAAAYRLRVPLTVHVGIGYDIIHEHPNCDGAVLGETSYRDFLIFAKAIEDLEGGVFLNYGTAVMGPEVYLKALAMARNVAHQEGRSIKHFTAAVFDLQDIPPTFRTELPKTDAHYYYRPWKTILVRTVADGGESFYFKGYHEVTLPNLARQVLAQL